MATDETHQVETVPRIFLEFRFPLYGVWTPATKVIRMIIILSSKDVPSMNTC